ncbi:trypsin-like peptidase domain-containing protein [Cellulomonas sp. zg-ZUI199]|uniref:Trypsin-like peptidase domain-containing protein n=1 Tax=Cellulomonas wangleii TaxID=2816956 RepID=A0ABX8DB06_9CELL|nr:trypsin-like peptidase domain-containing protein [Cellulomonas sp. zg-ZUI22]MBO0926003.1 trypsin-like peptidase domain-containing protein [Cellulomonas wangleii]QVI64105.1 trypsin-like peptidase domain-containing protein [Cellulomonas wangleii]
MPVPAPAEPVDPGAGAVPPPAAQAGSPVAPSAAPAPLFAAPSAYRRTDVAIAPGAGSVPGTGQVRGYGDHPGVAAAPGAAPAVPGHPGVPGYPGAPGHGGPPGAPLPDAPLSDAPLPDAPRRRRRRRALSVAWVAPLVALSLAAGFAGGLLGARALPGDGRRVDAGLPVVLEPGVPVDREPGSIAAIAAGVLPSVVSIEVTTADGSGSGSGFVLRQDGYVLTNNHVVAGASDGALVVQFSDGTEMAGTVVGATGDYDLAVVKVEATGLTPLALGDSDAIAVGDPVVAIGAPLGLVGTVTTGIVSALNRPVVAGDPGDTAFINAIQTDAAINPGNSGGPLVNARGEVVGINSAIAQLPGRLTGVGSIGLGFAIPSNQARRTAEQLIETGRATYPVIGVLLDPEYSGEGVRVFEQDPPDTRAVTPDGPADVAGIRRGDVILAIDGRPVTASEELIVSIRARTPGDTVVLRVRTGDDERDVRVRLVEGPSD